MRDRYEEFNLFIIKKKKKKMKNKFKKVMQLRLKNIKEKYIKIDCK
jgi:hypothetical protein